MNELLKKFNVVNEDNKISLTNSCLMIFTALTAFKFLFGGLNIEVNHLKLAIQPLDLPSVLPMLFSMTSYCHKRQVLNLVSNVLNNNVQNNNGK